MKKKIPIGISNFKKLIKENYYFVDKSLIIKEFIENGAAIILTPRPRRFGKTLNMSMIKYFFDINMKEKKNRLNGEIEYSRSLFNGLNIEKETEIMKMQGEFPVISISFNSAKFNNFKDTMSRIRSLMSEIYLEHKYLLGSDTLEDIEKEKINKVINEKGDAELIATALGNLTRYLYKHFNKRVILLIDEYDVPIQEGYISGYYEEIISFERVMFTDLLKDNNNVEKALVTGILRVAKESIFSGLNNLEVNTMLSNKFSDKFGFTQEEVDELLLYYKLEAKSLEVKEWYNGYIFGKNTIYNPWSVLNYSESYEEGFMPYWINSSANDLIKKLLLKGDQGIKIELEDLIVGKSITKAIDENIVMGEVEDSNENIWGFLLLSGYLKTIKKETIDGMRQCELQIPNKECLIFYKNIIKKWFLESMTNERYEEMLRTLIHGDIKSFGALFKGFVINNISYFDVSGKEPEKVYHAFVLGMLVSLTDTYEVKSNKESGYGRYDVMIIPKDVSKQGIIIEFKKINEFLEDTIEYATKEALKQIEDKKYESELLSKGITKIIKLAIVFKNKEVEITQG
ncbi:AAA family ATPase [Clostridium beijerinckii]|nr:AAA family ATPase [Clostridium beijerinckii]